MNRLWYIVGFTVGIILTGCAPTRAPVLEKTWDGGMETDSGIRQDSGIERDNGVGERQCTRDLECDDGLYCDGEERCLPAHVAADVHGCVFGTRPCALTQGCVEGAKSNMRCVTTCPDVDQDGYASSSCGGLDCNDNDRLINPGASEVCNGRDDNCNTRIDETFACNPTEPTGRCTVCNRGGTRTCDINACTWFPLCSIPASQDPALDQPQNNRTSAVLGPANYSVEFTWSYFSRTVRISVVDLDAPAGSQVLATQDSSVGCPCCNGAWAGEQRSLLFSVSDARRCHRIEFRFDVVGVGGCPYNSGANLNRITLTRTSQYTSVDP